MKQFAIGLTVFLLIILITACLAMVGYYHLNHRSESSEIPAGGNVENIASTLNVSEPTIREESSSVLERQNFQKEEENSSSEASSSESEAEPSQPVEAVDPEPKPSLGPDDEWRLMLVNQTHLLPDDYSFEHTTIEGYYTFDSRAAEALIQMLSDGRAAGHSLRIVSTYRTVERSEYLYTNKIAEYQSIGYSAADAAVEAARWIAPPRTSEHNAGLAIDVVSTDYDQVYGDLMHEFENFPSFTWLSEHCAEYGFVLRYPKDKQEITGITYEPWHYRYVGVEHAKKMQKLNMCLEEYVEWLNS